MKSTTLTFLWLFLLVGAVHAQQPVDITIFRDEDSVTVYVPLAQGGTVSLQDIGLQVTTTDGVIITKLLRDLNSFRGLPFDQVPTPICFRIVRSGSNVPLPSTCQGIRLLLTQFVAPADVFWRDDAQNLDRLLLLTRGTEFVALCPAGVSQCDVTFIPPTPLPTLTPTNTPEITQVPTIVPTNPPTLTPSPTITATSTFTPTITLTPTESYPDGLRPLSAVSRGWAMGGGNPSNSYWNAAEDRLQPPLQSLWSWTAENRFATDAISYADGIVYVGGMEESSDQNVVYAIEATSGTMLWRFNLSNGGGAMSNPVAVADGLAYFGGQGDDNIYALDAQTGGLINTVSGLQDLYARPIKIDNGDVFACSAGCYGFPLGQTNLLWHTTSPQSERGDIAVAGDFVIGRRSGHTALGTDLMAIDRNTGNIRWQSSSVHGAHIVTDNRRVYSLLGTSDSASDAGYDQLVAYDVLTGDVIWQISLGIDCGFWASMATDGDRLFIVSQIRDRPQEALLAVDNRSGAITDQIDLPDNQGPVAIANGVPYVGVWTGGLTAYDVNTLQELWSAEVPVNDMAVADGYLFVSTGWGGVQAYR